MMACAASPNGEWIVCSASHSRKIQNTFVGENVLIIWDIQKGDKRLTLNGHASLIWNCAVSPQGDRIVSASTDGTLKVWDAQTGEERLTLRGHKSGVLGCAVSHQGDLIASAS